MEEFLKLTKDGMLGNVPVIVVLTKYDMFVRRMERGLYRTSIDGLSDEVIEELVKKKAEAELQDTCIGPLQQLAGPSIHHATVSTETDYEETLIRLIRITEDRVHQDAAAVLHFITRQIDSEFGIKASIEVAKKRWKALALWTTFKNHELHTDIVKVWNFKDPHHYLCCQEFRELMVNIVVGSRKGYRHYSFGHSVLRHFMSYTVHLTLVLQTLYLVSRNQELTRRAIKVALRSYIDSPMSEELFACIQEYDGQLTVWDRMDRDSLDKIIEIMQFYDASELQEKIHSVEFLSDEPWYIAKS
ncbi:hypothetical protein C8R48DRAFT_739815 [Suillus tomentosus]|nr:hypothetical protein C8R48DRAFT_739815 [Suillus tomentosus]